MLTIEIKRENDDSLKIKENMTILAIRVTTFDIDFKCEECSKSSQLENHLPRKSAVGDIEPVSIFALCYAFMLCFLMLSELSTVIKSFPFF